MEQMIQRIKKALRVTSDSLNGEIMAQIEAAKAELNRVGVTERKTALYEQAIKLYVKWQYNFEGEADRYRDAFFHLEAALALSGDDDV